MEDAAHVTNGGQECPPSDMDDPIYNDSIRTPTEGGHSCPPSSMAFFNPYYPIEQHVHHLPHWQQAEVSYFVTWRLADALPQEKLSRWLEEKAAWLRLHPQPWDESVHADYRRRFSRQLDDWLDEGAGECVLRNPALSVLLANAFLHFNRTRYHLFAFVIMPNHVHVLFRPLTPYRLEEIIRSWKGFSARVINQARNRTGHLWQKDYWDRIIRNSMHFTRCIEYMRSNPTRANLAPNEYVLFVSSEGGLSSPPADRKNGGQECPPSEGGT